MVKAVLVPDVVATPDRGLYKEDLETSLKDTIIASCHFEEGRKFNQLIFKTPFKYTAGKRKNGENMATLTKADNKVGIQPVHKLGFREGPFNNAGQRMTNS